MGTGIFMGCPPEDVCVFIENMAEGYKYMENGRFTGMQSELGSPLLSIENAC